MADLTTLLLTSLKVDVPAHREAEVQLKRIEKDDLERYVVELSQELANLEQEVAVRQLAGLLLKQCLHAKDVLQDTQLKARWESFTVDNRHMVQSNAMKALVAPAGDVGRAAAQVVAKIVVVEISTENGNQIVSSLLELVQGVNVGESVIALTCMGFLCEDIQSFQRPVPNEMVNQILTGLVQGMNNSDPLGKLEAIKAMYFAVAMARVNFTREPERNVIMSAVYVACKAADQEPLQIAGFQCLAQIATKQYPFLMPYMVAIQPLIFDAIKSPSEEVALTAVEFWSRVCDEELALLSDGQSLNIIDQILPWLIPLLCDALATYAREDTSTEELNAVMAAGSCLQLVAKVVGDKCAPFVLHFVNSNFRNPDWKYRQAAALAYGSILEGPSATEMQPLVENSFPNIITALNDPSVSVRDTVAWLLGRFVKLYPAIVPLRELVLVLLKGLQDVPRVVADVCLVLEALAESRRPSFDRTCDTSDLSEFFIDIVDGLVKVAEQSPVDNRHLQSAVYSALGAVLSSAANDCLPIMETTLSHMINKLAESYDHIHGECELQGSICGVLVTMVKRLKERLEPYANKLMEESIKVFQFNFQVLSRTTGDDALHEDALLLVNAIVVALGPKFECHMGDFMPYLTIGLQTFNDVSTCVMSIYTVGALCSALGRKILPFSAQIIEMLCSNLSQPNLDFKIYIATIGCFGDIAIAITSDIEHSLSIILTSMEKASHVKHVPGSDDEIILQVNSSREAVLQGYASLIHSLRDGSKLEIFAPHVTGVFRVVKDITEDQKVTEEVWRAAVNVIGDLISAFRQDLLAQFKDSDRAFLDKVVTFLSSSSDPAMQQSLTWLKMVIKKYESAAQ